MKNDILNEDNRTGFHTGTVVTGADRPVTGGNDAPLDVNLDQLKASAKQAKNIIMGKGKSVSGGGSNDTYIYNDNRIFNDVDNAADGGSAVSDGLAWFGAHWKEAAIVAGAAAIIVALTKLVKAMNKSLKVRYNKVVKTLQRAQKDFTLKHDGLNMKSVLPGVGSGIFDWVSRMWTANWKSKKNIRGNIGLHPFCAQYIAEISDDYRTATDAFSKIKLGSEGSSVDDERNTDKTVDKETTKAVDNISTSAYSGKVYNSFYEAYREDFLNEGVAEDKVNESILAMISGGIALASLAARAGSFIYQRFKNGKPEGEPKKIQVTKESTREICYAIINNYADKYINMQQVWKELGISSESLADISTSDCDKLQTILKKYSKPEKNTYTKQYDRVYKAYKTMLRHYYAIGDGIISNFVKYSEAKDEKHANLVVASKEKLQNMWDSQKDFYDNNFSHVIIEITSSEPYIAYLDFIIEKVIPVFKSGLASDADYVLDIVPRKGEYYLLRQTGNGQANVGNNEDVLGNVAIAEITNFNRDSKEISFNLIGKLKDERAYLISQDGTADVNKEDIDYNAYKEQKENSLSYGKWMSLDPIPMRSTWSPDTFTLVYTREKGDEDQYIYAMGPYDEVDGKFNKIVFVKTIKGSMEVKSAQIFELDNHLSSQDIDKFFTRTDDPFNMGFRPDSYSPINEYLSYYKYWKPEKEDVKTTEDMAKIINKDESEKEKAVKFSDIYSREFDNGEKTYDQYVYAYGDKDDKDEFNTFAIITNKKGSNEILSMGLYKLNNYFTVDDINKLLTSDDFDPKFLNTSTNFSESKLKNYVERYGGNKTETQEVETTDDLIAIINKKIEPEKAVKFSDVYKRDDYNGTDQRVYAYGDKDDKDEFNNVVIVKRKPGTNDILSISTYTLDTYHTVSDLNSLLIKAGFSDTTKNYNDSELKNYVEKYGGDKPEPVPVHNTDELLKLLNDKKATSKYSDVYKRTVGDIDQYAFSYGDENDKYEFNTVCVVSTKGGSKEILSVDTYKLNNSFSETDFEKIMTEFKPEFATTGHRYDYSELKKYLENYKGTKTKTKNVGTSDELMKSVNTGELTLKKLNNVVQEFFSNVSLNNGKFTINNTQSQNVQIEDLVNTNQGHETRRIKVTFKDPNIVFEVAIPSKAHNRIDFIMDGGNDNKFISSKEWTVDKIISTLSNAVLKSHQNSSQEFKDGNDVSEENIQTDNNSVTVTYSYEAQISESSNNGSIINITRKFSERKRNWYVLSEAVYDDGSNKTSYIDNPKFVKMFNEKSDCTRFAKTSKLAKFMKFESTQTYQLQSDKGYTPSVATPLYESVLLVKLDKMDNVTDKVYLGKFKING